MKKVKVRYEGWGENWLLGPFADDGQHLLFEYSAQALTEGLDLSLRHLPLQKQAMGDFPRYFWRLPGLFADSLPDGWCCRRPKTDRWSILDRRQQARLTERY